MSFGTLIHDHFVVVILSIEQLVVETAGALAVAGRELACRMKLSSRGVKFKLQDLQLPAQASLTS